MPTSPKRHRSDAARGRKPRSLLTEAQWCSIAASLNLSGRELQIVRSIFDGRKEAAIAYGLRISSHTVHTHIERLYRKLDVSSRADLLIRVFVEACRQCRQQMLAGHCPSPRRP